MLLLRYFTASICTAHIDMPNISKSYQFSVDGHYLLIILECDET